MTSKYLDKLSLSRGTGDTLMDIFLEKNKFHWTSKQQEGQFQKNFESLHGLLSELRYFKSNKEILSLKKKILKAPLSSTEDAIFHASSELPGWADLKKIKRAEKIFSQDGAIICVLLFISSLPEVYRMQDISIMLNATGNLEKVTEQRIRTTALMTLSVLLPGGVHTPLAGGLPQILRARIIHAVLRNFLLRGSAEQSRQKKFKNVPPLKTSLANKNMFEKATAHGWKTKDFGIPCNQAELGYTLLTFSYVYLRSLRRLGIGLSSSDEQAYIHFWNVVGHFMGVETKVMAWDMAEAEEIFETFTKNSLHPIGASDPRGNLGIALVKTIEKSLEFEILKPVVLSLMEYLTSPETVSTLGLTNYRSQRTNTGFHALLRRIKSLDKRVQKFAPEVSLMKMIIRIMGFQLLKKVLSNPTNPIELPPPQRKQLEKVIKSWSTDMTSPLWLNVLEDLFTVRANWNKKLKF